MIIKYFFPFLLFHIVLSCRTQHTSPLNYKGKMIVVGNGGGFTGAVSSYYLLDNGAVYRTGRTDTSFIEVGKMEINEIANVFQNYTSLKIDAMELNEPGNRYYFIEKQEGDQKHKVQWGYKELSDKSLATYHAVLMSKIKKLDIETTKNN